jgi:hypothetical protein
MFDQCPLKRVNVAKGAVLEYDFPESCIVMESDANEDEQH